MPIYIYKACECGEPGGELTHSMKDVGSVLCVCGRLRCQDIAAKAKTQTLRRPFFFWTNWRDTLPEEVKGAGPYSSEFRKYANETQGKREI